jgi:hypothetical protein
VRVVIPHAGRRHPLVDAAAPEGTEWYDVGGDDLAYWRLMCELWEQCRDSGDDLLVLEHDVICRPDVVEQFEACDCNWGAFGYSSMCHRECLDAWANLLGCTRFRNELIRAVPDAVSAISRPEHLDWHNLCDGIGGNHPKMPGYSPDENWGLRAAGFTHHWHWPAVDHLDRNVDPQFWYGPGGRYAKEPA